MLHTSTYPAPSLSDLGGVGGVDSADSAGVGGVCGVSSLGAEVCRLECRLGSLHLALHDLPVARAHMGAALLYAPAA